MKNIIRYIALALVIVGIVIVMRNLFKNSSTKWNTTNDNGYAVTIKLLDKETKSYINGSKLVLKNEKGTVIDEWTTADKAHTIDDLAEGTYTLEQTTVSDGYEVVDETIKFKVVNKDKNVVMYNTKTSENTTKDENVKTTSDNTSSDNSKESNTVSSDVNVDNTLSLKSNLTYIISAIIIVIGLKLITTKRCYE